MKSLAIAIESWQHPETMYTLALEHSTATGSAALLRHEQVLASECWHDAIPAQRQLLSVVERILQQAELSLANIDRFAIGLGPGAYTNLRTSLSTVQGFALPERKPVRGISSAKALAMDLALERKAERIAIVGNARRDRLWLLQFDIAEQDIETRTDMTLVTPTELLQRTSDDEVLATPDWGLIGGTLLDLKIPSGRVVDCPSTPRAETVGVLAFRDSCRTQPAPTPPLTPIYIHPPVFVQPKIAPTQDGAM